MALAKAWEAQRTHPLRARQGLLTSAALIQVLAMLGLPGQICLKQGLTGTVVVHTFVPSTQEA